MKKAKTKAKATTKTTAKKTTAKKTAAKKTESAQPIKLDKQNKLERALAEKQLSKADYEMWKAVYSKEVPFNENIIEEDYQPRKTRRRSYYN
jgi:hypothetical protein